MLDGPRGSLGSRQRANRMDYVIRQTDVHETRSTSNGNFGSCISTATTTTATSCTVLHLSRLCSTNGRALHLASGCLLPFSFRLRFPSIYFIFMFCILDSRFARVPFALTGQLGGGVVVLCVCVGWLVGWFICICSQSNFFSLSFT